MNTPRFITTRSGVRISSAYTRPPARVDGDHERVQAALLEPRTQRPPSPLARFIAVVFGWL